MSDTLATFYGGRMTAAPYDHGLCKAYAPDLMAEFSATGAPE